MAKKAKVKRLTAKVGQIGPSVTSAKVGSLLSESVQGIDTTKLGSLSQLKSIKLKPNPQLESVSQQVDDMEMKAQTMGDDADGNNIYDPSIGYGKAGMKDGKFTETGTEAVQRIRKAKVKKAKK